MLWDCVGVFIYMCYLGVNMGGYTYHNVMFAPGRMWDWIDMGGVNWCPWDWINKGGQRYHDVTVANGGRWGLINMGGHTGPPLQTDTR